MCGATNHTDSAQSPRQRSRSYDAEPLLSEQVATDLELPYTDPAELLA